jgi:hypothetical protein
MDSVEKMDCRTNGEAIWETRKPLQSHFCEMSPPWIQIDRDEEMARAVESVSLSNDQ